MPVKIAYRIFLPKTLKEKVEELLEQYPPEIKNFRRDKLFYILSLIHEIPARNKRNGMSDNGFTNLNAQLLQKFVYNYREYLNYLLQHGIILCDDHFIPGIKSKGYRITNEYAGPVAPKMISNPELIRSLKKHRWELLGKTRKYRYLYKWMDGLEIDFAAAKNYIKAQLENRLQHPEAREWDYKRKRYKDPLEQFNSAMINLYYLKDKKFYFFVDPNVGRLHTNLTNMQSDLRNFITWKGQKLVSVDISNSQPYLAVKLFSPSFYDTALKDDGKNFSVLDFTSPKTSIISEISNKLPSKLPNNTLNSLTTTNNAPPLMLGKPLQQYDKQDVGLFIDLVAKGQLYEHLEAAFKAELGLTLTSRKNIKAAVFQVLFTDNRFIGQKEAAPKRIFKKLFPTVYLIFSLYKKQDATILPRLLQQIEARLILDIITKRIAHEKPHIPIFTIHDSITTTNDNLEYVKKIMKEELTLHIGIRPNLKVEYWTTEQLRLNLLPLNNSLLKNKAG